VKKRVKGHSGDTPRMFVELDLHKNYLQAAVVDDRGTLLKEERIPIRDEDIQTFSSNVLKERAVSVIESLSNIKAR
jgi:hypothetical protein